MLMIDDVLLSHTDMESRKQQAAAQFGLPLHAPQRYAVCRPDAEQWLPLLFALRERGASVLPLHPTTPMAAAERLARQAQCHGLIFGDQLLDLSSASARDEEPCLIQMSSGTTGAPKIIARSWSSIDEEVQSYVSFFREPDRLKTLIACPVTHSYGLIAGLLVALKRDQTPRVLSTDNPKYVLKSTLNEPDALLYSSPALLHMLARLTPVGQRMNAVMTSGTTLPLSWFEAIRAKSRHVFQQYGCSEAGCIAINSELAAPDEIGRVLPHHHLVAGTVNEPAEIIIKTATGPIRTGDLGALRDDGMLIFASRLDDMINVAGLNVYPKEVEDVVMAHPAISDAVAFRKPDPFAGERVALAFSASRAVSAAELRAFCQQQLAGHQIPAHFIEVARLPREANGKISRRLIAQTLLNEAQSA